MSGSLSSKLSYADPPYYPPENGAASLLGGHIPAEAAERTPTIPTPRGSDSVVDPLPDSTLSVVSAVSLEPRRRNRHHQGHHSPIHRELAHMLSMTSRDAKELRRGLNAAFDKLDQSRARASHAEKLALDMLLRVREAEEERTNAMREASTAREELGKHKALLDSAHGEIRRAQQLLQDQDHLRYEAEASAARARDNARQMKQRRLVDLAREQGRKMGYNEGIQAGQRIGYYEGQSPDDDERVYPSKGPRFREVFDESKYALDDFDQPPPLRDINLNPSRDLEVLSPAPLATHQGYPAFQDQQDEVADPADDAAMVPPAAPYTRALLPRGVQHTASTDSTTTLPAAPATLYASSRAPPPMPTIPEVSSTEVGSTSWTSRSPRGSQRVPSHILPALAPQGSTHAGVPPSIHPFPSQDGAAFEPPPGSVEVIPSGLVGGYPAASIYAPPSPRAAFDDLSIVNNEIIPGVTRSPVQERFVTTPGPIQSPAQEHSVTRPRTPVRERFMTTGPIQSPAQEHSATRPRTPVRERFVTTPGPIRSPAQEHLATRPRTPVQEHLATIHSPRAMRPHAESVQLANELRDQEFSATAGNRAGGPTPRPDGPPKRHPVPQMPAPLDPNSYPNVPYSRRSHGTTQHRRPSGSDNLVPHDAGFSTASNWNRPSSQTIPSSAERPQTDTAPARARAMSPRTSGERLLDPSASHDPRLGTVSRSVAGDSPVSQPATPQTLPPRVHVQIPPTRYHAPNSASPRLASPPTAYDRVTPTDLHPSGAMFPSPNANTSDLPRRSPPRYPPTLYNEPQQQQHVTTATYEQDDRGSPPVLPVPSRDSWTASPRIIPLSSAPSRRSSYVAGQRTATGSPRIVTDALPVPPPSMSPHPSLVALPRNIPPPQGAVTPSTPRRTASPNPLPRSSSPAPLPRASSPAPLPIRSPSVRSANIRRTPSNVSLPGAPGSPYRHYNPSFEADIAALATSAERLPTPAR